MKKTSKKKKGLKTANLGRLSKKIKLLLIAFFAVGASLAAYSVFASPGPKGPPCTINGCSTPGSPGGTSGNTGSTSPGVGTGPNASNPNSTSSPNPQTSDSSSDCTDTQSCLKTSPIVRDINMIVKFLSIGVAVIVVGSIVLGGIQYSAAGNKPEAVAAARTRIANSFIALGAFLLIFAFLEWLIPGGIFNK